MFNNAQHFSFKHFLPLIGICLCLGVLILLGGFYFYQQKSLRSQPEKRLLTPTVPPTLIPTLTFTPGQKAICTYYIQAISHEASPKGLALTQADSGKTFTVDIGTLLILYCKVHNFYISTSSPQDIFEGAGSPTLPIHLPANAIGAFRVIRAGLGTIQVTGTK